MKIIAKNYFRKKYQQNFDWRILIPLIRELKIKNFIIWLSYDLFQKEMILDRLLIFLILASVSCIFRTDTSTSTTTTATLTKSSTTGTKTTTSTTLPKSTTSVTNKTITTTTKRNPD